jgi:hypothetical protein
MWKIRFVVFNHTSGYTPGFVLFVRTTQIINIIIIIIHLHPLHLSTHVLARVDGSASQQLVCYMTLYSFIGWLGYPLPHFG